MNITPDSQNTPDTLPHIYHAGICHALAPSMATCSSLWNSCTSVAPTIVFRMAVSLCLALLSQLVLGSESRRQRGISVDMLGHQMLWAQD